MRQSGTKMVLLGGMATTAVLTLAACESDQKVIEYKPFFTGLEGAEFGGQQPVVNRDLPAGGAVDAAEIDEAQNKLVVENPDGSKRLILASPLHVMRLTELLLNEGHDQLMIDQLFSEKTLLEFGGPDRSAQQAVDYLREHQRDLSILFARMPLAENSPTVIVDQPGDRTWIIRLTGKPAEGLRFTRLWVRMEHGKWKFLWVT